MGMKTPRLWLAGFMLLAISNGAIMGQAPSENVVKLSNAAVDVRLDRKQNALEIKWLDGAAGIHGAAMHVEVDGKVVALGSGKATVGQFDSPLGGGKGIIQEWSGDVGFGRTVELLEDWPVIKVSSAITNNTDRPIGLGTISIIESPRFEVGDARNSPAAVFVGGDAT